MEVGVLVGSMTMLPPEGRHFALEGRFDLALDLEVVEQGDIALYSFARLKSGRTSSICGWRARR